jgi:hypothetical protein
MEVFWEGRREDRGVYGMCVYIVVRQLAKTAKAIDLRSQKIKPV